MIQKTIQEIEEHLHQGGLSPERKQELLTLLAVLRSEVAELAKTHGQEADAIAGLARTSTEAATQQNNPELLAKVLGELSASVEAFEKSHPKLVQVVNRIATTLSNLGI